MTDQSLDDLARRLEQLPREAWDRPVPPPAPWPQEEAQHTAPRRRLILRPVVAVAASAALVVAGLLGGLALSGGDGETGGPGGTAQKVQLEAVGKPNRGATGVAELTSRPDDDAVVRVSGLQPSSDGEFYELWLLGEKGELVSLGSFSVPESGVAELEVPVPVDPGQFRYLDVSREPADGDPAHSTDSVLRGPVT
jgi:anti-sigma-K factor RskA